MIKQLEMDLYIEGFNYNSINCIDLPVASAAGCFKKEYYFYYSFFYCFFNNWTIFSIENLEKVRSLILNKLGLTINPHTVTNKSELVKCIKDNLDNSQPVIMMVKYNSLFYYKDYLNPNNKETHAIVITGYDSDRSVFIIRDFKIVDRDINKEIANYFESDPQYKLQITYGMLFNIWLKSNESFKIEKSNDFNKVYSINEVNKCPIECYMDLLYDITTNYDWSNNALVYFVKNLEDYKEILASSIWIARRQFEYILDILFKIIEKCISQQKKIEIDFYQFKEKYIKYRRNILSIINANALRGKSMDNNKIEGIISDIYCFDNNLFDLINTICKENDNK